MAFTDQLAGAFVGSLITLGSTAGVRFLTARRELEANDREVAAFNEDLERWVVDDHARLKRELRDLRNDLNSRNLFYSGEYGCQLGLAKERAIQAYRDQAAGAERQVAAVRGRRLDALVLASRPQSARDRARRSSTRQARNRRLAQPAEQAPRRRRRAAGCTRS